MSNKYHAPELIEAVRKFLDDSTGIMETFSKLNAATAVIANTDAIEGSYKENLKSYYNEVHILAQDIIYNVVDGYKNALRLVIIDSFLVDTSKTAKIDSDYLSNDIKTLVSNFTINQESQEAALKSVVASIEDIVAAYIVPSKVADKKAASDKVLDTIITKLNDFANKKYINSLNDLMASFGNLLNYMGTSNGGTGYTPGAVKALPWYEELIDANEVVKNENIENAENLKGFDDNITIFSPDPVNLSTGNLIYEREDISTNGSAEIKLKRFYNSIDITNGCFASKWIHNYEVKLKIVNEELIKCYFEDGRVEKFNLDGQEYMSQTKQKLSFDKDNYLLKHNNGDYTFNSKGQLTDIDMKSKQIKLEYTNNKLTKIKSFNEYIALEYNEQGYISKVSNESGYEINYTYINDNLTKLIDSNQDAYQYEYDGFSNLLKVINPKGIVILKNEFDLKSRTTMQYFGDGSTMSYQYNDVKNYVEMIERNKSISKHYHDEYYRNVKNEYGNAFEEISFNKYNARTMHRDKNGNIHTYEYDDDGNLTKINNPYKKSKVLKYNKDKKPLSIELENGAKSYFEYDANNNLVKIINPLGYEMKIKYNKHNLPIEVIDFEGNVQLSSYDDIGNIISQIDGMGNETKFIYNQFSQIIEVVKADGNSIKYKYTNKNKVSSIINEIGQEKIIKYTFNNKVSYIKDFDGNETVYEYNNVNKINKVIENNDLVTIINYDKMWNVCEVIHPNNATKRYSFNKLNQLETYTNELGGVVHFEHDNEGNVLKTVSGDDYLTNKYDALNRAIESVDAHGSRVNYKYDEVGNLVKISNSLNQSRRFRYDMDNNLVQVVDEKKQKTRYQYNKNKQLKQVTNPYGMIINYEYANNGLIKEKSFNDKKTIYKYNKLNLVCEVSNQNDEYVRYEYDQLERIIKTYDNFNDTKIYEYDQYGNVSSINVNGVITKYEYDMSHNLCKVTDVNNGVMEYSYDKVNQLIKVEQYQLNEANELNENNKQLVYEYKRNAMNQITSTISADSLSMSNEYNEFGLLTRQIEKDGSQKQIKYGMSGLIESIELSDGKEINYEYNLIKQITKISDNLGSIQYEYDEIGNVNQVIDTNNKTTKYKYGSLNELLTLEYDNGHQVKHEYDNELRLSKMISDDEIINYQYNNQGLILNKKSSKGIESIYEYNEKNLLSTLKHQDNGNIIESIQYEYDQFNNIIKEVKDTSDNSINYHYDKLNRLVQSIDNQNNITYEYDYLGNRSKQIKNDIETNYYYNEMNQLIKEVNPIDSINYQYDLNGRLTCETKNNEIHKTLEYNSSNRLSKVNKGIDSVQFTYDALNKLVGKKQVINNEVNEINYNVNHLKAYDDILIEETDQVRTYTWDNMGLSKINDENVLLDHLGSITSTIGKDGITKYTHDTFGQGQHFTGYQYDEVSELSYAQARFYDPKIGRFISEDVLVNNGNTTNNFNRYAYCLNNPLKYVDKNGKWPSIPSIDDIVEGGKDFASGVGDFLSSNIIGVNHTTSVTTYDGIKVITNSKIGSKKPLISINTGSLTGISVNVPSINTPLGNFGFNGTGGGVNYSSDGNLNIYTSGGFEMFSHGYGFDNKVSAGLNGVNLYNGIQVHNGKNTSRVGLKRGMDLYGINLGVYGSISGSVFGRNVTTYKEIELLRLNYGFEFVKSLVDSKILRYTIIGILIGAGIIFALPGLCVVAVIGLFFTNLPSSKISASTCEVS